MLTHVLHLYVENKTHFLVRPYNQHEKSLDVTENLK
jgi:hypothetical protein